MNSRMKMKKEEDEEEGEETMMKSNNAKILLRKSFAYAMKK
jgi:hypothetical protein